jgi:hypothetical protein
MASSDHLLDRVAAAIQENIRLRQDHRRALEQLWAEVDHRLVAAETTYSWAVITELRAVEAAAKALRDAGALGAASHKK